MKIIILYIAAMNGWVLWLLFGAAASVQFAIFYMILRIATGGEIDHRTLLWRLFVRIAPYLFVVLLVKMFKQDENI